MTTPEQFTGWFCVSARGRATQCKSEAGAKRLAVANDEFWPPDAPHRAVQLVEATAFCELLTAAQTTLTNNLHLADGDNCTLIDIKRAVEKITGKPA